jgi:hypothetical protein
MSSTYVYGALSGSSSGDEQTFALGLGPDGMAGSNIFLGVRMADWHHNRGPAAGHLGKISSGE